MDQHQEKRCSRCGLIKPVADFGKDKNRKDGLMHLCRPCNVEKVTIWGKNNKARRNANIRAWAKRHPEKVKSAKRAWKKINPLKYRAVKMVVEAKRRAREKNLPFDIDSNFILKRLEPGVCERTGLPFVISQDERNPYSPSLDKVVPRLGYVKGNVRVILWALNSFKADFTESDIYPIAKKFCNFYEKQ